ncbi:MAG: RsmB/NOP family class I SAM-dependent RNA methyltransferase [Planctomycetes bacterium]|nr:RsmB/NOP family class I SAM-dependent RNA methyltransferase [Planctomycetota bacterium]MBL7044381.1 RsmB/NOP family class I SAM-dependent RNA methyltransferase [Pirellulaceae bacterium]
MGRGKKQDVTAPSNTLKKLATRLFADQVSHDAFIEALTKPADYSPALVWLKDRPERVPFDVEPATDWQPEFVDRVSINQRPGQHPLHQQGDYYCLDFSSVFTACCLYAVDREPNAVIDLCASPGGKSIFAWRLLRPEFLLANEVIKKRTAALISNLGRCEISPAAVVAMDSSRLAAVCPQSANLVIVDAPCSGQSLIARGKKSPGCFHPATINMNANRQRRILANAVQLVAPGGYLAYITCSYSLKENENNVRWLLKKNPQFQPIPVNKLRKFQSHLADIPCYRLWPQDGIGAGGFAAIFKNAEDGIGRPDNWSSLPMAWRSR